MLFAIFAKVQWTGGKKTALEKHMVHLKPNQQLKHSNADSSHEKKKPNVCFASCWTRHLSPAGSSDACAQTGPGEVATPAAAREWQC